MIYEEGGRWHTKKKKSTGSEFRKDSTLSGLTVDEVYDKLKAKIKLP